MGFMKDLLKPQVKFIDLRQLAENSKSSNAQVTPEDRAPYIEFIKTHKGLERRWVRPRPAANTGSRRDTGIGNPVISPPFPPPSPPQYLAPPAQPAPVPAAPTGDTKFVMLAPVKTIDASTETEDCKCPYVVKPPAKSQPQISKKNKKGKKNSPTPQVTSEESEELEESEESGSEVSKQPKGKHSKAQKKAATKRNTSNNAKEKKQADTKQSKKQQAKKHKSSLKAHSKSVPKCNCVKQVSDDSSTSSAPDESEIDADCPAKLVHPPLSGQVNPLKEPKGLKFAVLYEEYLKRQYEDDLKQLSAMKAAAEESLRKTKASNEHRKEVEEPARRKEEGRLAAKEADQEAAWDWFRKNQQALENTAVNWVQERDTARKEEDVTAPSHDDIEASARRADVQRANEWVEERARERNKIAEKPGKQPSSRCLWTRQDADELYQPWLTSGSDENPGNIFQSLESNESDDRASTPSRRRSSVSKKSSRPSKARDTKPRRQMKHVSFAPEASVRYPNSQYSSSDSHTTTSSSSDDTPPYQRPRRAGTKAVDIDINYETRRKSRSRLDPVYVIRPKGRKYTVNGREAVVVTRPGTRKAEEEHRNDWSESPRTQSRMPAKPQRAPKPRSDGHNMSEALQNRSSSKQYNGNRDNSRRSWRPTTSYDGPSGSDKENWQNGNKISPENYGTAPTTWTNPRNSNWNNGDGYNWNQNEEPTTAQNISRVSSWNDGGVNNWQRPDIDGVADDWDEIPAWDRSDNRQYEPPYFDDVQDKPNDPYAGVEW